MSETLSEKATHMSTPLTETDLHISLLLRARYPIIAVASYEEHRVLAQLGDIWAHVLAQREGIETGAPGANQILRWSCTSGLQHWSHSETRGDRAVQRPRPLAIPEIDTHDPTALLLYLRAHSRETVGGIELGSSLLVFADLHPWLDRDDPAGRFDHLLVRALRDLAHLIKYGEGPRGIILLAPRALVPVELRKEMQVIDYPLPTCAQLERRFLDGVPAMQARHGKECITLDDEGRRRLMRALSGLTLDEADNVLARALARNGRLEEADIADALDEKKSIIQKDGTLEFFDSDAGPDEVGGLELLQEWLELRRAAFTGQAVSLLGAEISLPVPRGILLTGAPGSGKSLVAKVVAKRWGLPLLRLDTGRIFTGRPEENMRRALRVAESIAPAVIWLDEVEQAFRGDGAERGGGRARAQYLPHLDAGEAVARLCGGNRQRPGAAAARVAR